MPRYKAVLSCTDFDGRFYQQGEIVELSEGKHSDWLILLDKPTKTSDTDGDADGNQQEQGDNDQQEQDAEQDGQTPLTEESLKALTKAQLVDLGQTSFGLSLSVKSKEADIIAAILAAQSDTDE